MFKHYLLTAVRSARRDTTGFLINLLGLTTGFAVFVLAFSFVHYETTFDDFFQNKDRIHRVVIQQAEDSPFGGGFFYSFFPGFAEVAKDTIPEVEDVTRVDSQSYPIRIGENYFPTDIRFIDPAFFDIFELEFIEGSIAGFEDNAMATVLSYNEAIRLFGSTDVIGKTFLIADSQTAQIIGVFKDLPQNSHFETSFGGNPTFGILMNNRTSVALNNPEYLTNWGSISSSLVTYLLLKEGSDVETVEKGITQLWSDRSDNPRFFQNFVGARLTKLQDLNFIFWERQGVPGLLIAQGIGVLILVIAVFNSISINSARMIGRSREIGLRRIMGATRRDLIRQFTSENIVISLAALLFSIAILYFILPTISIMSGRELDISTLLGDGILALLIGIAILVGVLSSAYPIVLMSGLIKGLSLNRTMQLAQSAAWLRKGLATIQFTAVTALVLSVVVVNKQNQHLLDIAPEFETGRIALISGLFTLNGENKVGALKNQIEKMPGVESVSRTNLIPYSGNVNISMFSKPEDVENRFRLQVVNIDPEYMPLHGVDLLAGRNIELARADDIYSEEERNAIQAERDAEENEEPTEGLSILTNVLLNVSGARELGFSNPKEAIGQQFYWGDSAQRTLNVVGIVPDLKMGGLNEEVRAAVYFYNENQGWDLSVLFQNPQAKNLEAIETLARDIFPGNEINVQSLDVAKEEVFQPFKDVFLSFVTVAVIALILAGTGLYALAAFLANSKKREVGVRKVLGAQTHQLIKLFLWQFSKPIALALIMGIPVGIWSMTLYLEFFPSRVELAVPLLVQAGVLTLVIGWLTILIHVIRAAKTHPAIVLRDE